MSRSPQQGSSEGVDEIRSTVRLGLLAWGGVLSFRGSGGKF